MIDAFRLAQLASDVRATVSRALDLALPLAWSVALTLLQQLCYYRLTYLDAEELKMRKFGYAYESSDRYVKCALLLSSPIMMVRWW